MGYLLFIKGRGIWCVRHFIRHVFCTVCGVHCGIQALNVLFKC